MKYFHLVLLFKQLFILCASLFLFSTGIIYVSIKLAILHYYICINGSFPKHRKERIDRIEKVVRKIPRVIGWDKEEEEEGWELFNIVKPPWNITEKKNDDNDMMIIMVVQKWGMLDIYHQLLKLKFTKLFRITCFTITFLPVYCNIFCLSVCIHMEDRVNVC